MSTKNLAKAEAIADRALRELANHWGDPAKYYTPLAISMLAAHILPHLHEGQHLPDNTHDVLAELVSQAKCKPGWSFRLVREEQALRLVIQIAGYDSSRPDYKVPFTVNHFFPVPQATYNMKSWRRWMFEMCRRVENHELGEWFRIGTERPFEPLHGPGEDPYTVHEFRDPVDGRTIQDGSIREAYTT